MITNTVRATASSNLLSSRHASPHGRPALFKQGSSIQFQYFVHIIYFIMLNIFDRVKCEDCAVTVFCQTTLELT
jgi:hypothetical protein